jgi:adenylate kinase
MIIFSGVVGSGKSVQGRKLADELALPWLSTGEFLRMLIAGQQRRDMLAGKLIDDEQMIAMIQRIFSLVDTEHEFVLDGFPRSSGQADWLLGQVKYGQLDLTGVVHLNVSLEVVKERLLARGRLDDNEDAIAKRFHEFEHTTLPMLDQFRKVQAPIYEIDGDQSIADVHQAIMAAVA